MSSQSGYKEPSSLDDPDSVSEHAATAAPGEASAPIAGSSLTESVNVTSGSSHSRAASSMCVTRTSLSESMQQLIDDINAKRKEDTHLMENYKKASEMHVHKACEILEQVMFDIYEKQGKVIQAKLHKLVTALNRTAQLESELHQFKQMLGLLYQDIQKEK